MHSYSAYGLVIHSELPLPDFRPGDNRCDVVVRLHKDDQLPAEVATTQEWLTIGRREARLLIDNVGTFLVRDGREISIYPAAAVDPGLLRRFLTGMIMSFLLYQRGLFVLHASAVKVQHGAVALLGDSGAGKSSVAAALHARGHAFITDDVGAVRLAEDIAEIIPGFPRLKVSLEVADALGIDRGALTLVDQTEDKRGYTLQQSYVVVPVPLSRIYILTEEPDQDCIRLSDRQALIEYVRHSIPTRFERPGDRLHFRECLQLSHAVPVFRISRARSIAALPDMAERLEQHCLARPVVHTNETR